MKLKFSPILLLAILSMSIPMISHAARPLGPPIKEFFNERNRVAIGELIGKQQGNKIEMRISSYLYQNDEELVTLSVDEEVFSDVVVGNKYVFVFSRMSKNRLLRDEWEVNPKGPSLASVRGLGTPTIYKDNSTITALVTLPEQREPFSPDKETGLLLKLAEDESDSRARELGIFELYLRPDLQTVISEKNGARFAALTAAADPRLKTFLLRGAARFPDERRTPWLEQEWRTASATYGTQLDLNSYVPLLLKISLEGLRETAGSDDVEMIGKHLYSNAPGVAKAALQALDAADPQQALARVQEAVQMEKMHMSTRQAFIAYIKRHEGA